MAESGRPTRNYALRGKVKYLCDEYPSLESLHKALSEGTDDLWGEKISSNNLELSKPHFKLLHTLDENERFRELDVVFEYVIPGTARRIDAIVFGEILSTTTKSNTGETQVEAIKYALILELKAWYEERWGDDGFSGHYGDWKATPDWRLHAYPNDKESDFRKLELDHPCMQVLSYRNFLKNFHSAASRNDWLVQGASFLPGVWDNGFLCKIGIDDNADRQSRFKAMCDRYIALRSEDDESLKAMLHRLLDSETSNSRSEVTASDFACDEFLQGTYMVPMSRNREGNILRKICSMSTSLCKENDVSFEEDLRTSFFKGLIGEALATILESGINGSIKDKKWLIVANMEKILDENDPEKGPSFINHADITMGLLCSFLQTGYPYVSMQTDYPALQAVIEELEELFDPDPKNSNPGMEPRVKFALKNPIDIPIDKVSYFNVFNAYKWESAVCTTIGIVDLCGRTRDEAKNLKKPSKQSRGKDKREGSLQEFLENSAEAHVIFLLVDDKTPITEELAREEDSFAGFTIINWPKE